MYVSDSAALTRGCCHFDVVACKCMLNYERCRYRHGEAVETEFAVGAMTMVKVETRAPWRDCPNFEEVA